MSTRAPIPWWRDAIVYEVYVRSFADGDGDGVGDLPGIQSRLPYLAELGVDAIWITPFYPSPQADHGYDVADYRDVDHRFGTLGDFDALLHAAHVQGVRVMIDIVPNHTSSEHPWFQAALAAQPGSAERSRYVFRPGRGRSGAQPPNNWRSTFGGRAWTQVPDGEWYLHMFDVAQPDLNWHNPDVHAEFESILRFWLDRGVDGIRIDVANRLVKASGLPDDRRGQPQGWRDQDEVHDIYRRWRRILDGYDGDRVAIGEIWEEADRRVRYTRPDELHQAFDFDLQLTPWSAAAFRRAIVRNVEATASVGASPTWVLSSHDQMRHVTRYGGGQGLARARAATLLVLALPGSTYLFQGEELGLPQVDVAPDDRQDPVWERSGNRDIGRDGCRVPIPWTRGGPTYGFGPGGAPAWLPQPRGWGDLSVEAQDGVGASTLELYRAAIAVRRDLLVGRDDRPFAWEPSGPGVIVFSRGDLVCATNFASRPRRVPAEGTVVLSSGAEPVRTPEGLLLPPATTVWIA